MFFNNQQLSLVELEMLPSYIQNRFKEQYNQGFKVLSIIDIELVHPNYKAPRIEPTPKKNRFLKIQERKKKRAERGN